MSGRIMNSDPRPPGGEKSCDARCNHHHQSKIHKFKNGSSYEEKKSAWYLSF